MSFQMQQHWVQSLVDKFKPLAGTPPQTTTKLGTALTKYEDEDTLNKEMYAKYQAGIRKLQHLVCNS